MNGPTFSPNPRKRGKSHRHHISSIAVRLSHLFRFDPLSLPKAFYAPTATTASTKSELFNHGSLLHSVRIWCGPCVNPAASINYVPAGSPSRGGDVKVYVLDINQPSLPTPFTLFLSLFLSCGPFTCISIHKFSHQLSVFSLCSPSLISASLVLSTIYLILKVSLKEMFVWSIFKELF